MKRRAPAMSTARIPDEEILSSAAKFVAVYDYEMDPATMYAMLECERLSERSWPGDMFAGADTEAYGHFCTRLRQEIERARARRDRT
jgi:hypothetical protein